MEGLINKKQDKYNLIDEDLAEIAGLSESGRDEENNKEYIGTQEQWNEYERLEREDLLNDKLELNDRENFEAELDSLDYEDEE